MTNEPKCSHACHFMHMLYLDTPSENTGLCQLQKRVAFKPATIESHYVLGKTFLSREHFQKQLCELNNEEHCIIADPKGVREV